LLNVAVQSNWKACSVSAPPFLPSWENLEGIILWQKQALVTEREVANAVLVQSQEIEAIAPVPTELAA
jgi:hypothetical protein